MSTFFSIGENVGLEGFTHPSNLHLNKASGIIEEIPDVTTVVKDIFILNREVNKHFFSLRIMIDNMISEDKAFYKVSGIQVIIPAGVFDHKTGCVKETILLKTSYVSQRNLRKLSKPSTENFNVILKSIKDKTVALI